MTDRQEKAAGLIAEHVQCVGCGYDRFGTADTSVCPECGQVGYTGHFRGRRRLRMVATAVLALAAINLSFGIGVRIWLYQGGIDPSDFREFSQDRTEPLSPCGVRAAPYLSLVVHTANALVAGSLLLALLLVLLPFALWFRDARAALLMAIALAVLVAGAWLGLSQGEAMLGG